MLKDKHKASNNFLLCIQFLCYWIDFNDNLWYEQDRKIKYNFIRCIIDTQMHAKCHN